MRGERSERGSRGGRGDLESILTPANPGALAKGERACGRLRSERDYLAGVSVRVGTGHRIIHSTATLSLYEIGRPAPLRQSRRSTRDYADDSWQLFPFDSIRESVGKEYRFVLETDAEHGAIALAEAPDGSAVDCRATYSPDLARLFDPVLARGGRRLPEVPEKLERYLDRHVYQCLHLRRYFFLRLAHLADALGRIPEPIADVLSIGAGVGYQEAFLAGRFPEMQILATDFNTEINEFPMSNLRSGRIDLLEPPAARQYDFVFSIECLEHIEDFRTAFRNKAAMVKPGKYLYISVPFASHEEKRDPGLRKSAWESFEHFTPGFNFDDLDELFAENGLEVLHASNMFFLDVVLPLRRLIDSISPAELECGAGEIARLFLLDLRTERVESSRQAEGIRYLGRKRDS